MRKFFYPLFLLTSLVLCGSVAPIYAASDSTNLYPLTVKPKTYRCYGTANYYDPAPNSPDWECGGSGSTNNSYPCPGNSFAGGLRMYVVTSPFFANRYYCYFLCWTIRTGPEICKWEDN
ncbi:MAG: hypothetical protein H0W64_05555 [Gammaproteobacteria bacterium]|nr:hypothetical protein [Gammaproteobacteria bacterium]